MKEIGWTGCKKCNRVLYEKDADKNGLCVDCAKLSPAPKKESKKED